MFWQLWERCCKEKEERKKEKKWKETKKTAGMPNSNMFHNLNVAKVEKK
jgi:hypothetical protein